MKLDEINEPSSVELELARLKQENDLLRTRLARKTAYIREKTRQLLTVADSAPLIPEELDDDTLLELDPIGIVYNSLSQSISNLQRINDQFREGEERWRTIFMSMLTGLVLIRSEDHIIVDLNPAAAAMMGRPREEIIGKRCNCFICPSGEGMCPITDLSQEVDSSERMVLTADGSPRPVMKSVTRVRLYGKEHLVEGLVDISARKRAEADLAADREMMALTLGCVADTVITTDTTGRISFMNRGGELLTGWSQDEAVGRPVTDLIELRDGKTLIDLPEVVHAAEAATTSTDGALLTLVRRDGSTRNVSGKCRFVTGATGPLGIILVLQDVTSQQQMEDDLLKARKLESVGLLAGGIVHDFNNLLTGIMGNISIARSMVDPSSPAKERLRIAEEASRRAHELIRQIFSFSRKETPARKQQTVLSLVTESAQYVTTAPNISCRLNIPSDIWPIEIDKVQMGQVVQNLILNASQSMPDGGEILIAASNVTIDSTTDLPVSPGSYVRLSITDNGIGISADQLEKIFDPYFTTKKNGTGLGLAISRSIVQKHDGTIAVESKPEQGTTFIIFIPAAISTEEKAPQQAAPLEIKKKKVLVLDDDHAICEVASSMLTYLGYDVRTVFTGENAVELFRQEMDAGAPFSCVILDLTIPGSINGAETIRRIRAIAPDIQAIISSGNTMDPVITSPEQYGFNDVMLKPYRLQDLKEVLHRLMPSP